MVNTVSIRDQIKDTLFLSDGGLETELIFKKKFDLPLFAAFDLLKSPTGYNAIREYYEPFIQTAISSNAQPIIPAIQNT